MIVTDVTGPHAGRMTHAMGLQLLQSPSSAVRLPTGRRRRRHRRLTMYIGGGLLALILLIIIVVLVLR